MNWPAIAFDWNQIRAFLATVEEGSFSAAARALGQTQPTLSRQISALEGELGITLFERGHRAMVLTEPGRALLEPVRAMAEAATRISLTASGQSLQIAGRVSLTATNSMATQFLPPVVAKLRQLAPEIELEIIASNEVRDLTLREADIAIRHARPEQPELIGKLLRETRAWFYASTTFLNRHGRPQSAADLTGYDFIGFDQNERFLPYLNDLGLSLTLRNFKLNTGSDTVMVELIRQGLGIGMLTEDMAALHPELERALPSLPPIPVPIWLVTHRELHTSRRIRLVFDLLAQELGRR
ncbi:LysR family transcriptional regulator [uncultured Maricaulis sp.]|uniref:LysR family transcriptional regulator n=1 Tax=uncultured Maricaulis sp. TaxID=174710 RepID=UPI0030D76DB1|tara:strand:+ start:37134 stop:38024 length:891 start_codon:yes stop_codon:yes gene_type:complete